MLTATYCARGSQRCWNHLQICIMWHIQRASLRESYIFSTPRSFSSVGQYSSLTRNICVVPCKWCCMIQLCRPLLVASAVSLCKRTVCTQPTNDQRRKPVWPIPISWTLWLTELRIGHNVNQGELCSLTCHAQTSSMEFSIFLDNILQLR